MPLLCSLQTLHLKVTLIRSVAHPVGHSSWPSRWDSEWVSWLLSHSASWHFLEGIQWGEMRRGFSPRKIRLKSWLFPSISVIGASYLPPVWKPPLSHLLTWLDGITQVNGHEFEQVPGDVKDREAWRAAVLGVTKSQKWLSNWTTKKHGNHISNIHLTGLHKDEVACFKVSSFICSFNKHLLRVLYILDPM